MTEVRTHTLDVPGAKVVYDIRPAQASTEPPLLIIGSPMDAGPFAALAELMNDRTVVTYDPRGTARSTKDEPGGESTPEQHVDDVHRIIDEIGGEPVDVFATSGGAVNALALAAKHPEQLRTVVAHEPPMATALPDREQALAAIRAVRDVYEREGFGAGMAKFIALADHRGPIPDGFARQPGPSAADLGLPEGDDGSRGDALLAQNLVTCTRYEPDYEALRAAPVRIVLAAGVESDGQLASRAAQAVAAKLGAKVVMFPSHHNGFMGAGESGPSGEPEAFAAALRKLLSEPKQPTRPAR